MWAAHSVLSVDTLKHWSVCVISSDWVRHSAILHRRHAPCKAVHRAAHYIQQCAALCARFVWHMTNRTRNSFKWMNKTIHWFMFYIFIGKLRVDKSYLTVLYQTCYLWVFLPRSLCFWEVIACLETNKQNTKISNKTIILNSFTFFCTKPWPLYPKYVLNCDSSLFLHPYFKLI